MLLVVSVSVRPALNLRYVSKDRLCTLIERVSLVHLLSGPINPFANIHVANLVSGIKFTPFECKQELPSSLNFAPIAGNGARRARTSTCRSEVSWATRAQSCCADRANSSRPSLAIRSAPTHASPVQSIRNAGHRYGMPNMRWPDGEAAGAPWQKRGWAFLGLCRLSALQGHAVDLRVLLKVWVT